MKNIKMGLCIISLIISNILSIHSNEETEDLKNLYLQQTEYIKSPDVAAMDRYGEYPVNLSTGIPDISIPLYTIQIGDLNLPLSLSYHLGGIKVDDVASSVGLGWNLNAGGCVSRSIRGKADEAHWYANPNSPSFLSKGTYKFQDHRGKDILKVVPLSPKDFNDVSIATSTALESLFNYFEDINTGAIDSQSDVYNFNIGGTISGAFEYNLDRKIIQKPLSDNKIERINNDFYITDSKGVLYVFKNRNSDFTKILDPQNDYIYGTGITAWHITEIISADKQDTIHFAYHQDPAEFRQRGNTQTIAFGEDLMKESPNYNHRPIFKIIPTGLFSETLSTEMYLSTISTRNVTITFNRQNDRKDRIGRDLTTNSGTLSKRGSRLASIVIKDKLGKKIKSIEFDQDYFRAYGRQAIEGISFRLRLNSIKVYGIENSNPKIYRFSYHPGNLPPYYNTLLHPISSGADRKASNAKDYWGYYNGETNNEYLFGVIPNLNTILFEQNHVPISRFQEAMNKQKANREPDERYMRTSSLSSITYPTGGSTHFITEANRVYNKDAGEEIITGGLRISEIRTNTKSSIINPFTVVKYNYLEGEEIYNPSNSSMNYISTVGVHTGSYRTLDNYPTVYKNYLSEEPFTGWGNYQGSIVLYTIVEEVEINTNSEMPNGKIVSKFQSPAVWISTTHGLGSSDNPILQSRVPLTYDPIPWKMGKPLKKTYYKFTPVIGGNNGNFNKVKEITYKYDKSYVNQNLGLNNCTHVYSRAELLNDGGLKDVNARHVIQDYFDFYFTHIITGYELLTEETEEVYSEEGQINTSTYYYYDNINKVNTFKRNYLLTAVETGTKNGVSPLIRKEFLYAQDYETNIEKEMVNYNMIGIPIQQRTLRKKDLNMIELERTKVIYSFIPKLKTRNTNIIKPVSLEVSTQGSNLIPEITFDEYDIFGNVSQLTTKDGISTSILWGYAGEAQLAQIRNAKIEDVNSYISEVDRNTINRKAKPSQADLTLVNNLRKQLKEAEITSYTHYPTIGVSSITTPNDLTTFFEYDPFARLSRTYIKEDNIYQTLKRYFYNYVTSTTNLENNVGFHNNH